MEKYDDIVNLLQDIYKNIEVKKTNLIKTDYQCNMTNNKSYLNDNHTNIINLRKKNDKESRTMLNKIIKRCKNIKSHYDNCTDDANKINKLLYEYKYTDETYNEILTLYNKYINNNTNITIDDIKNIPTIIKNYLCIMNENFNIEDLKIDDKITLETINNKIVENIVFYIKEIKFDMYDKFVDLFRNTIRSLSLLNQFLMKEKKSIYKLNDEDEDTYFNVLKYTISTDNISIEEITNTIESYVNSYTNVYIRYLDAINGYKEYIIDKYKNINNKDTIISNMNIFFKNFNNSVTLLSKKCCIIENISAENCSFYYLNDKMNEYD